MERCPRRCRPRHRARVPAREDELRRGYVGPLRTLSLHGGARASGRIAQAAPRYTTSLLLTSPPAAPAPHGGFARAVRRVSSPARHAAQHLRRPLCSAGHLELGTTSCCCSLAVRRATPRAAAALQPQPSLPDSRAAWHITAPTHSRALQAHVSDAQLGHRQPQALRLALPRRDDPPLPLAAAAAVADDNSRDALLFGCAAEFRLTIRRRCCVALPEPTRDAMRLQARSGLRAAPPWFLLGRLAALSMTYTGAYSVEADASSHGTSSTEEQDVRTNTNSSSCCDSGRSTPHKGGAASARRRFASPAAEQQHSHYVQSVAEANVHGGRTWRPQHGKAAAFAKEAAARSRVTFNAQLHARARALATPSLKLNERSPRGSKTLTTQLAATGLRSSSRGYATGIAASTTRARRNRVAAAA
jgi:hypothetical protein